MGEMGRVSNTEFPSNTDFPTATFFSFTKLNAKIIINPTLS